MIQEHTYTLKFPDTLVFSEDEFFEFCQKNPEINIERDEHQNIIIMSPTGSLSGYYSALLIGELVLWNKGAKTGHVFDSSTGFTLPDGSVRSPDVSWVSKEKWGLLTLEHKKKFAPICPEFVIEVKSASDSLGQLQSKMEMYIRNGIKLGWLFDIEEGALYIYKQGTTSPHLVVGFGHTVSGEGVLPGFEMNLNVLITE